MRVKPPSGGPPPTGLDGAETIGAPEGAGGVSRTDGAAAADGPSKVAGAAAPAETAAADPVGDVARRLKSGELSPREAVELLIDDAVSRQVGRVTADRQRLASELKELLRRYTETDPYLAAKVRRLAGGK